jgi:diketogulonate reductase-like aldo/keto reductase
MALVDVATYQLSDGTVVPQVGFGTYRLRGGAGRESIIAALGTGYRLLDTAVNYRNETEVGAAMAATAVPRDEILVATKVPGRDHGYDQTRQSYERSRRALAVDVIDSYLIHWPNPSVDRFVDSWRAMIDLREEGLVRSIGVCNFTEAHLQRLADETGVLPALNQVELHPHFPQVQLRAFHAAHGVRTESWSPLGRGQALREPAITTAADAHGVTPAQVVLRWHLQLGALPIPKSASPARQRENLGVFGFALTPDEVAAITALGRPDGRLFGGDPDTHEEM